MQRLTSAGLQLSFAMADQFAENLPTDRRHVATREELLARMVKEFDEMAGLSLTFPQACRLFDVRDPERCARGQGSS